jgi:hypothetical protein
MVYLYIIISIRKYFKSSNRYNFVTIGLIHECTLSFLYLESWFCIWSNNVAAIRREIRCKPPLLQLSKREWYWSGNGFRKYSYIDNILTRQSGGMPALPYVAFVDAQWSFSVIIKTWFKLLYTILTLMPDIYTELMFSVSRFPLLSVDRSFANHGTRSWETQQNQYISLLLVCRVIHLVTLKINKWLSSKKYSNVEANLPLWRMDKKSFTRK